ncbi:serine dehydratase beta chain [Marinococcus luteus]|uniref:serine dehydratase beta chain n=1 Tax=Marinococcus luteus TaxID=1122204 RepID=UPI002ACC4360|nr:serine dehydratase beta chain [Marinococcus luteus]MDZ5782019.1 serine dehydratase beta chain [Marinococcus luteus]
MDFDSCFDIIGPIMVGPSSSHTAGVVSIGKFVHDWLGDVTDVTITFYGSLASTYQGHGSDKAILSGLLGLSAHDTNVRSAYALAKDKRLRYDFRFCPGTPGGCHPNTVALQASSGTETVRVSGASIGGGVACIYEINSHDTSINLGTGPDIASIAARTKKEASFI